MKKIFATLIAAILASVLCISASAETEKEARIREAEQESFDIIDAYHETLAEMETDGPLSTAEAEQVVMDAFEDAGWTIVDRSGVSAQSADVSPEVMELAYMDIDAAGPDMKEKILDARREIIYQFSWTNDIAGPGNVGFSLDLEKREAIFDPLFSELFPGWDPPKNPVEENAAGGEPVAADMAVREEAASPLDAVLKGTLKGADIFLTAAL